MNNKFGLTDNALNLIIQKLAEFEQIKQAKIYGSRAIGTYWHGSDIDIAIYGDCSIILGKLITEIDELPLPYKFDITDYAQIDNQALQEHIDRVGVVILDRLVYG